MSISIQYNNQSQSIKYQMPKYSRSRSRSPGHNSKSGSDRDGLKYGASKYQSSRDKRSYSSGSDSGGRYHKKSSRSHHHKSSSHKHRHKSSRRRSYSSSNSNSSGSYHRRRDHKGKRSHNEQRRHREKSPERNPMAQNQQMAKSDSRGNNRMPPPAMRQNQPLASPATNQPPPNQPKEESKNTGADFNYETQNKTNFVPEVEWDKATADQDYIYIPRVPPYKRKHKGIWTDADENEIAKQILKEKNQALGIQLPQINNNPDVDGEENDDKIRRRIYIPINTGVNYIGLLIGPRGLYQKRLEEESGCKILIRGKGSQKCSGSTTNPPEGDEEDEQHVLIIGDDPESVRRAETAVERVISADDSTRDKIRHEQLIVAQQLNNTSQQQQVQHNFSDQPLDESMMTPYGAPSPYAYIIPVPNDTVGLIIGQSGQTIRRLQNDSGAKIQVAKVPIKDKNIRNVFVEADHEKYILAKEAIEKIINDHKKANDPQIFIGDVNPFGEPNLQVKIQDKHVGLVIGKQGETLKNIATASETKIFMPQKSPSSGDILTRVVEIHGDMLKCHDAENRIKDLIREHMERQNGGRATIIERGPRGALTGYDRSNAAFAQQQTWNAAGSQNYYQANNRSGAYSHQYASGAPQAQQIEGSSQQSSQPKNQYGQGYTMYQNKKKTDGATTSSQQNQQNNSQQAQQYPQNVQGYGSAGYQQPGYENQAQDYQAMTAAYQSYNTQGAYDAYYAQSANYYNQPQQQPQKSVNAPAESGDQQQYAQTQDMSGMTAAEQQQWQDYYNNMYYQQYYQQQADEKQKDGEQK